MVKAAVLFDKLHTNTVISRSIPWVLLSSQLFTLSDNYDPTSLIFLDVQMSRQHSLLSLRSKGCPFVMPEVVALYFLLRSIGMSSSYRFVAFVAGSGVRRKAAMKCFRVESSGGKTEVRFCLLEYDYRRRYDPRQGCRSCERLL